MEPKIRIISSPDYVEVFLVIQFIDFNVCDSQLKVAKGYVCDSQRLKNCNIYIYDTTSVTRLCL